MKYSKIYNPKTQKFVSVNSKQGQYVITNYINQLGGATGPKNRVRLDEGQMQASSVSDRASNAVDDYADLNRTILFKPAAAAADARANAALIKKHQKDSPGMIRKMSEVAAPEDWVWRPPRTATSLLDSRVKDIERRLTAVESAINKDYII